MNSNSGIYIIKNTIDERVYVGSAFDLKKRKWSHLGQLKRKNHHCAHLQNFVNKHGIDTLCFDVLEYVEDKESLIEREQFYLNNIQNKFNSAPFAIPQMAAAKSRQIKVFKYCLKTLCLIDIYDSIEIAKDNTPNCKNIIHVLSGKRFKSGGFYWSHKELSKDDLLAVIEKSKLRKAVSQGKRANSIKQANKKEEVKDKRSKASKGIWQTHGNKMRKAIGIGLKNSSKVKENAKLKEKKVYQYSLDRTQFINQYDSRKQAAIENNICPKKISNVISGHVKQAGGFYWSDFMLDLENAIPYVYKPLKSEIRKKKVYQYSMISENELINEYDSCAEAGRKNNIPQDSINTCARGGTRTAYGFIWSYKRL